MVNTRQTSTHFLNGRTQPFSSDTASKTVGFGDHVVQRLVRRNYEEPPPDSPSQLRDQPDRMPDLVAVSRLERPTDSRCHVVPNRTMKRV